MENSTEGNNENNPNEKTHPESENVETDSEENTGGQAEGGSSEPESYNVAFNTDNDSMGIDTGEQGDNIVPVRVDLFRQPPFEEVTVLEDHTSLQLTFQPNDPQVQRKRISYVDTNIAFRTLSALMRECFLKKKELASKITRGTQTDTPPKPIYMVDEFYCQLSSDIEEDSD